MAVVPEVSLYVSEIAQALEEWAPLPYAESYDNVGLLVGNPSQKLTSILINLDMTEAVVDEAIKKGIGMIVAHHPIWFSGRKRLIGEDYVSRVIMKAIKHDISLYAIHTNLDNVRTGVNEKIAQTLGLVDTRILHPKSSVQAQEEIGAGKIGRLETPMEKVAFLEHVKKSFNSGGIRYADYPGTEISTVAVCGGSGSFLTSAALAAGADAFVTADITYHKFFDQEESMLLLDIGHYESEQFTSELIHDFLCKKFRNFAVRLSNVVTNPVKYF